MYQSDSEGTRHLTSREIGIREVDIRDYDEVNHYVPSSDVNKDFNTPIVTEYPHNYVEPVSIQRLDAHKAFQKALRRMGRNEEMIAQAPMPPDIRDHHRDWLDWLHGISQSPHHVPLKPFLKLSGSVLRGSDNDALEWRTMRGQEAMVHKAVRIVYPKPWHADLCIRALLYGLLLLSFPGSAIVVLGRKYRSYIPHCFLWTLAGTINLTIAIVMVYRSNWEINVWFVMGTYAMGIYLVAAGFGLPAYGFYMWNMEKYWPAVHHYKQSAHRHFAENRVVALVFRFFYGLNLPTYSCAYIYPIMYPLLGTILGAVGALFFIQKEELEFHPVTMFSLIGANLVLFVKVTRVGSRSILFKDPALERLRIHGRR